MNYSYLQIPAGECHGDEHLIDCVGDCEIWCTCHEKLEAAKEHEQEMYAKDMLRGE